MVDDKDGWNEWARRVLGDIERIDRASKTTNERIDKITGDIYERIEKSYKDIQTNLNSLCIEIAVIKTKAAIYGAIWGAVVGSVMAVITAIITALIIKAIN
jgi:gas vesicle protein